MRDDSPVLSPFSSANSGVLSPFSSANSRGVEKLGPSLAGTVS